MEAVDGLKIVYLPISALTPYDRNAKEHPRRQIDQIKRSISDYGMRDPIGIWGENNTIVEGHGRWMACKELGFTEVPCIRLDDMTDAQRREYALVHNQTTMNSGNDPDLLNLELADLDFDAAFYDFEVQQEDPAAVEDDFEPVVPEEPKAHIGDIYALGRHRLMCGDSTLLSDVEALMGGEKADMLLTDPPYNVDYGEKERDLAKYRPCKRVNDGVVVGIKNDVMESNDFRDFLRSAFANAKAVMLPGAAFHIWHAETEGYNFRGALMDVGMVCRQQLIWVKSIQTLGRQDFQRQYEGVLTGDASMDDLDEEGRGYEPALYGWKEGAGHRWYKQRKEKDVMFFQKPLHSKEHPTMKPIPLFDYEMKCNTKPGDNVLDLFGGSGTTLIAAEQNGRNAFVMEYDERFVDVIIERWERFTGQKAVKLNE